MDSSEIDMSSLKDSETYLGSTTDCPTLKKLDDFLALWVRTLEAIQLSKPNLSETVKNNKQLSVKGLNTSTNSKWLICKESQHSFKCEQFRELSIDQCKELTLRLIVV